MRLKRTEQRCFFQAKPHAIILDGREWYCFYPQRPNHQEIGLILDRSALWFDRAGWVALCALVVRRESTLEEGQKIAGLSVLIQSY